MLSSSHTVITNLRNWEAFKPMTYQDVGGVWTGGYGHTGPDVKPNRPVTRGQAEAWLAQDLRATERAVANNIERATQEQFDALVLFTFNVGAEAFRKSKLRRLHNLGDYAGALAEFGRWNHVDGEVIAGLTNRRKKEAALYEAGCLGV